MSKVNDEKEFGELLMELHKTISIKGIRETIRHLKTNREAVLQENKISDIKKSVIDAFGVDDCLAAKKEDLNKVARCLFAYALRKEGIENETIAGMLSIHRNTIYKLTTFVKKANLVNPKAPCDILLKEAYDKIYKTNQ